MRLSTRFALIGSRPRAASHLAGASIGAAIAMLGPALYSIPHGYGYPREKGFRARAFLYVLRSLGSLTNKADEEFRLL